MKPEIKKRIAQINSGIIPEGYKKTKVGIVPVEWEIKPIKKMCDISSGNTPSRNNTNNFNGNNIWLSSGELKSKYVYDSNEKISNQAMKALKIYSKGTVVIAIYGLEAVGVRGSCSILAVPCTISQACMAFENFKNMINEYFYYWYQNNGEIIGLKYAQGTKQQNLSNDIVEKINVVLPPISEQKKIVEILSTQDKLIELQERKIEQMKTLKKGYLQKMFPKKGSSVPELRFNGFTDNWEQRKFGEIFVEYSEKNHEELPPLTIIQGKGTILREESDRKLIYDKSGLKNYKLVNDSDFILHLRSFEGGLEVANSQGIVSPAYHIFHGEGVDTEFYYLFFRSKYFISILLKPHVYGIRDGKSIDVDGMKTIKIPYPKNEEQKAIGRYFESFNSLITLHQRKLNEEKQKKKALMQLLLTGKVRVV